VGRNRWSNDRASSGHNRPKCDGHHTSHVNPFIASG
jgi:hypothetical protein